MDHHQFWVMNQPAKSIHAAKINAPIEVKFELVRCQIWKKRFFVSQVYPFRGDKALSPCRGLFGSPDD
jgi:hypothetical protein